MVEFKLCIGDKTGKTYPMTIKGKEAESFIGLNIGESIKGDLFGLPGYEFLITGGSDYCGFPMRKGILGIRKKITSYGGVGFRKMKKGIRIRKTVCGQKINPNIVQINLKIIKKGEKDIKELLGIKEEKKEKVEQKLKEGKKKDDNKEKG